jgi:hypothetical protein
MKTKNNAPLTPKQKAFVQHIVNNPKESATKAALATYGTTNKPPTYNSAAQIATTNLKQPQIISELAKYNNLAENTLINAINDYQDSDKLGERALAVDTAKWVHDKVNGKAIQRQEVHTTGVQFSIDLSQAVIELDEQAAQQG